MARIVSTIEINARSIAVEVYKKIISKFDSVFFDMPANFIIYCWISTFISVKT